MKLILEIQWAVIEEVQNKELYSFRYRFCHRICVLSQAILSYLYSSTLTIENNTEVFSPFINDANKFRRNDLELEINKRMIEVYFSTILI